MESGLPALIIAAVFLLAASFLSRSGISSYEALGQHIKQVEARTGEQARTRLTIVSASLDAPGTTLTVQLRDDGSTNISSWSALDVLVSYYTGPSSRVDAWIPYVDGGLSPNTWTVVSITSDAFEPGILNPGETATIEVGLSPAVASGTTNEVVIATDGGVTVSAPFTG